MIREFIESVDPAYLMIAGAVVCFGFLIVVDHLDKKYLGWGRRINEFSKLLGIVVMFSILYFPLFILSLLMDYF